MDSEQKSFSCPYIFPYRKHIIKEITVIFNESTLHKKNYTGILLKNIEGLVMLLEIGGNEHFRLVDLIKYQIFVTPEENRDTRLEKLFHLVSAPIHREYFFGTR